MLSPYSNVQTNLDGSLTLVLGSEPAADFPEANWLPTPLGRPFLLNCRTHVLKESVKRG